MVAHKPIEQIALLDQVVTAEGNIGIVTHTMVRGETEGILALKLWGNNLLRLTSEHPVLTQKGYVKAGELTAEDFVAHTALYAAVATGDTNERLS